VKTEKTEGSKPRNEKAKTRNRQKLKNRRLSAAVAVILYVDGVVHGGGGGVGFFVGGDFGFVLEAGANVVEAYAELNFRYISSALDNLIHADLYHSHFVGGFRRVDTRVLQCPMDSNL
jgi:hypothetical protein